jgi:hypothetical protein
MRRAKLARIEYQAGVVDVQQNLVWIGAILLHVKNICAIICAIIGRAMRKTNCILLEHSP